MAKDNSIVINEFYKGIGQSPYVGFEHIRGLNITDKPGVAYPNFSLVKESSTTITDKIIDTTWDNQGQLWACSSAKLYKRTTGGVWSSVTLAGGGASGTLHGVAFWGATTSAGGNKPKGFIFLFAGNVVDLLSLADETTWSKGWTNLGGASAPVRRSFVASNNILYISNGSGYGISSIAESTFNAFDGTTGTATISTGALTLPKNFIVSTFQEIGTKLLICGQEAGNDNGAMIIPWNKALADFDIPIKFYEDGDTLGWQIVVIGLKAYVQVGKRGQWYVTNGTEAVKFAKVPVHFLDTTDIQLYPDAVDVVNGLIYFAYSYDSAKANMGIYSLNPETGFINFEHLISTGNDGTSTSVEITSLNSLGNKKMICTWADNSTTYGADKFNTTRYTSDAAYLISQFIRTGATLNKRTINKIEVQLSKPLASGDSVKLYYRTAQNGTWLNVQNQATENASDDTMSFIDTVGDQSYQIDTAIECENIQIKCILNDEAELLEIRLS